MRAQGAQQPKPAWTVDGMGRGDGRHLLRLRWRCEQSRPSTRRLAARPTVLGGSERRASPARVRRRQCSGWASCHLSTTAARATPHATTTSWASTPASRTPSCPSSSATPSCGSQITATALTPSSGSVAPSAASPSVRTLQGLLSTCGVCCTVNLLSMAFLHVA
jgi:hypothetical protein